MDTRFAIGQVFVVSVMGVYFLLEILSTEGVTPPASVLVLVFILWFSVYKLRHEGSTTGLGSEVACRPRRGARGDKGEGGPAGGPEAGDVGARGAGPTRAREGRRRRASGPTRESAVDKYVSMIESRVRERKRSGLGSEGP
jgi:hypothetical protein